MPRRATAPSLPRRPQATALVSNGATCTAGLFLGLAASSAMFLYCVQRALNTGAPAKAGRRPPGSRAAAASAAAAARAALPRTHPPLPTAPQPPAEPATFPPSLPAAEYEDAEWPGAKAWPSGMALIAFFELSVMFQGVRADFMF